MRNMKLLRASFVFIFLSLLFLAFPAPPAQAVRGITLSPTMGTIGTRVTVTGTEFNKSTETSDRYAAIYFSSDEASTIDDIDVEVNSYKVVKEGVWLNEDGDFETKFNIPEELEDGSRDEDVVSGTYYVYVCHYQTISPAVVSPRIRAVATFTVTMGQISVSPLRGTVDTLVEITGTDYAGNKDITINYDGSIIAINSGDRKTDSDGDFTSIIRIPDSTAGPHTVTAIVADDDATASFTVEPEILINPTSGEALSMVIVSGTAFGKLKRVNIWFYNTAIATATTNARGSFYVNFNVPDLQPGLYNVDAEQGTNVAKAKFTITTPPPPPEPPPTPEPSRPALSISTTTGNIGQGIVMGGSGFKPDATITIKYDNELLNAVSSDSNGVFAAAFNVPPSKYGKHTIIASDGTNISELSFDVESTPPPVLTLLIPASGDKVTSPIIFAWQAITDPSPPVTYDLEINTSSDFATTATVLDKKGLTKTEYTLTETEKLRLGASEKPYYWRVRATDGASNEGSWSNPWTFYVASGGTPTWAIIVIAVIGAIFLLALGYLIRTKIGTGT